MPTMTKKELCERLGTELLDEITKYGNELRRQRVSPDKLLEEIKKRFPGITEELLSRGINVQFQTP